MLGVYYLILSVIVGYIICSLAFPSLKTYTQKTYKGRNIGIPSEFLLFPSSFIVGIVLLTWTTYILAYLARDAYSPLKIANTVVLIFYTIFCILFYLRRWYNNKNDSRTIDINKELNSFDRRTNYGITKGELIYLFFITFMSIFLMCYSFYIINDTLHVGFTIYSDFSPHIGMVRSFSKGNNFPTHYTFFAGEDIRYHFMFFFLVGNLEFLDLRLDFAMNIPSAIGLISTYLLLYILAVKITGRKTVGYLGGLFFTFRSSISFFSYLSKISKDSNVINTLINNTDYIGFTPKENWGLWNLNVYINQRHFPFALGVLLFVIIMFLPKLYKMFSNIELFKSIKTMFFTKEGWVIRDLKLAIFVGILAGATAFWNGASLIALISILFLMAILSTNRLEYLLTAVIATSLSLIQSGIFVEGRPVSPQVYFGFIVENPDILNVIKYIFKLFGVLPLLLIISFIIKKNVDRYIFIAFLGPAIIAFTLSLTPDVTVNHKYLMISIMLLGIYGADLIVSVYKRKSYFYKSIAVILITLMTITGVYDFATLIRSNKNTVRLDVNHEITKWIQESTNSQDVFLTAPYALNQVVLGGPSLYLGWPYFPWSAGYDTFGRNQQVKLMYEVDSSEELDVLAKENNIRYIIVDRDNRVTKDYVLNEENIKNTYECVFEMGDGEYKTSIYDTEKLIH